MSPTRFWFLDDSRLRGFIFFSLVTPNPRLIPPKTPLVQTSSCSALRVGTEPQVLAVDLRSADGPQQVEVAVVASCPLGRGRETVQLQASGTVKSENLCGGGCQNRFGIPFW